MGKNIALSSVILTALCLSTAVALASTKPSLEKLLPVPDEGKVRKNFNYLVSLIHNKPGWLTQILLQIKKEMTLRGQIVTRNGEKCDSCLFQIQYNFSGDRDEVDLPDDHSVLEGVLMDDKRRSMNRESQLRLLNELLNRTRTRRSALRKNLKSAVLSDRPTKLDRKASTEAPRRKPRPSTTEGPPSQKATSSRPTVPTTTSSAPKTTPSTSVRPSTEGIDANRRKILLQPAKFAETDSYGRAIHLCSEHSRRTFCRHNGRCIKVKILEMQSCICPTGFRGQRCESYDVVGSIKIIDRHSSIRSFEDIQDDEERARMVSSIAATAYYTINTFVKRMTNAL